MKKKGFFTVVKIVFLAMMAAIVCVVSFFRFPLLGSKVHFANAMCLLSGLLFGPLGGGIASGLGSALSDVYYGYELDQIIVTFITKFLMAAICAWIAQPKKEQKRGRILLGCIVGAISYVILYMLKTFVYQAFVYGFPMETVWATMLGKLPAAVLNAVVAVIAAPIFYAALRPALKRAGILKKMQ